VALGEQSEGERELTCSTADLPASEPTGSKINHHSRRVCPGGPPRAPFQFCGSVLPSSRGPFSFRLPEPEKERTPMRPDIKFASPPRAAQTTYALESDFSIPRCFSIPQNVPPNNTNGFHASDPVDHPSDPRPTSVRYPSANAFGRVWPKEISVQDPPSLRSLSFIPSFFKPCASNRDFGMLAQR
jgi:hypothetical protein